MKIIHFHRIHREVPYLKKLKLTKKIEKVPYSTNFSKNEDVPYLELPMFEKKLSFIVQWEEDLTFL